MKLFDSHCHLHFYQFDDDREEIIGRIKKAGIKVINVGTDLEESEKAIELAKNYPNLMWASVGLHPNDLEENFSAKGGPASGWDDDKYRELAKSESVVAIGECGLDYYRLETRNMKHETYIKNKQKEVFIKQIDLAIELKKPLIVHCRPSVGTQDAYEDAIEILLARRSFSVGGKYENFNISNNNGVAHFFSGSKEIAKKFLNLGFYISFAGPITFPPKADQPLAGASQYKEVVEFVPMDRILIETDSPFAAPAPHRGHRNEPAFVEFVARKIAEWKNLSFEEVADQTTENAKKLFQIK